MPVTTKGITTLSTRKAHRVCRRALGVCGLVALLAGCGVGSSGGNAAVVNGNAIPMEQYASEFQTQRVEAQDSTGYDVCRIKQLAPACSVIKQKALNIVIDNELVREYARKHGLTVTAAESNRQWIEVFKTRFHNQVQVEAAFLKHLGISDSDLRRSLRDDLLQEKVEVAVTSTLSPITSAVRVGQIVAATASELKQVKALIKAGVGFPGIANYLRHTSRSTLGCASTTVLCGDLGWTPDAFIPPDRHALITARDGTILGPYRELHDWLILKAEAHSTHYLMTAKQLFARRQQLFLKWLQVQQRRAKVTRYVAV